MPETEGQQDYGHAHLTAKDFLEYREQLSGIVIAPFDPMKAKGVGYNFSLSEMIYSITRNRLVPVCHDTHETYFFLHPAETVLALSYEYLKVDKYIAGSFHSRVRMTAQGVGSISTTLDPGWKGMLLFSLNNPTRKKIKIVLSTRSDGVTKMQSVLTLVAWRTVKPIRNRETDGADEYLTLHLDNPPMRIDIWSELVAKPLRLFRNREYQKFSKLIDTLSPFDSHPSQRISWVFPIQDLLSDLDVAIDGKKSASDIRSVLIRIRSFNEVPSPLNMCLNTLTMALEEKDILQFCTEDDYQKAINLAKREIQYQLLCDQIDQIHELISKSVPISWRKNFWANVWHQFLKNSGIVLATLYFTFLMLYGQSISSSDYWQKLLLAFVPLVVSIIYHLISGSE